MTDKKISALDPTVTPALTDIFAIIADPAGSPASKRVTGTAIQTLILGSEINTIVTDAITVPGAINELDAHADAAQASADTANSNLSYWLDGKLAFTEFENTFIAPQWVKGTISTFQPTLGAEILDGTGWTSAGWTGNWVDGWTHTTGNVTPLSRTMTTADGEKYQVSWVRSGGSGTDPYFRLKLGTVESFGTYLGGAAGFSVSGSWAPTTTANGDLIITPSADFNGTLVISVKLITGSSDSIYNILDNSGAAILEVRTPAAETFNTFMGRESGGYNTNGNNNTAFGAQALKYNTSGVNNCAFGAQALLSNVFGNGNSAFGLSTLVYNTNGTENSVFGDYAAVFNTLGSYNDVFGAYALYHNTVGNENSIFGRAAGQFNETGIGNAVFGYWAFAHNVAGSYNSAFGHLAGKYITGGVTPNADCNNSIYIGSGTRSLSSGRTNEIVLGTGATGAGDNTITLGNVAASRLVLGNGSVSIDGKIGLNSGASLVGTLSLRKGVYQAGDQIIQFWQEQGAIADTFGLILTLSADTGIAKFCAYAGSIGITLIAMDRTNGYVTVPKLAGAGNRAVMADANGKLYCA